MELDKSFAIAFAGLTAQGERLKVIAENLANVDSTALTPDADPYKRKVVTFENVLDRSLGVDTVRVASVKTIDDGFGSRYEPGHPAADANGYVKTPNVNSITELMDMREAQRSYEANLNIIDAAKSMLTRILSVLSGN
jgi:flagellar basal-body rod protein FlgC